MFRTTLPQSDIAFLSAILEDRSLANLLSRSPHPNTPSDSRSHPSPVLDNCNCSRRPILYHYSSSQRSFPRAQSDYSRGPAALLHTFSRGLCRLPPPKSV